MSDIEKLELDELLARLRSQGYTPVGLVFYDTKLKLIGLAPLEKVPDAFVEMLGRRLSGMPDDKGTGTGQAAAWATISKGQA